MPIKVKWDRLYSHLFFLEPIPAQFHNCWPIMSNIIKIWGKYFSDQN